MHTQNRSRRVSQRGQYTIIGLVVAMAIILILGALLYPKFVTPGGVTSKDADQYSSAEQKAEGVACGEYYSQIQMAIRSYRDSHGTLPPDLKSLSSEGVTADMWNDPACGFTYDPSTGSLSDKDTPAPAALNGQAPAQSGATSPNPAPAGQPGDIYGQAEKAAGAAGSSGDTSLGN